MSTNQIVFKLGPYQVVKIDDELYHVYRHDDRLLDEASLPTYYTDSLKDACIHVQEAVKLI